MVDIKEVKKAKNINKKFSNGNTFLHFAILEEKIDIIKYLLSQKNINVFIRNNDKKTPFDLAKGNREMMELFEKFFRRSKFSKIYDTAMWGYKNVLPKSGHGSTLEYTKTTRKIVKRVIKERKIRSIFDSPCGDLTWMSKVLSKFPKIKYTGGDIVEKLIDDNKKKYPKHKFKLIDLADEPKRIPKVDLIICRDLFQHLTIADTKRVLENINKSGAKYLLTSTYLRQSDERNNIDIRTGDALSRNLLRPPFSLSDPLVLYSEQDPISKYLGLWRLPFTYDFGIQE